MKKPDRRAEIQHVMDTPEITQAIYDYMDSLPLCEECNGWGGSHWWPCSQNPLLKGTLK